MGEFEKKACTAGEPVQPEREREYPWRTIIEYLQGVFLTIRVIV